MPAGERLKTQSYIPSTITTQMNLVAVSFCADWTVRAVLKIFAILLRYPTLKTLINIKVRDLSILPLKCTFLGQNRPNHTILISCPIGTVFIVLGIYNFEKTWERNNDEHDLVMIIEWLDIWPRGTKGAIMCQTSCFIVTSSTRRATAAAVRPA